MPLLFSGPLEDVDPDRKPPFGYPTVDLRLIPLEDKNRGIGVKALIDTGADVSLMSQEAFLNLSKYCRNADLTGPEPAGEFEPENEEDVFYRLLVAFDLADGLERFESPLGVAIAGRKREELLEGWDLLLGRDFLYQLRTTVTGEEFPIDLPEGSVEMWG